MRVQHGNSQFAHLCTATISRAGWTLPVTSCSCRVPRPTWTEPSGRELLPPAGLQTTRAGSHDVTRAQKKNKPRNPRGSPREHTCPARP